jgi:hypothetical protein
MKPIQGIRGFGTFHPATGSACFGQGAQFSVTGANFEAVFSFTAY